MFGPLKIEMTLTGAVAVLFAVFAACGPAPSNGTEARRAPVYFDRDIRPILSDLCLRCHRPGYRPSKSRSPSIPRKASAPFTTVTVWSSRAILPPVNSIDGSRPKTKPSECHPLIRNKVVRPDQKALIRRWIEQGAIWEPQKAFNPYLGRKSPASRTRTGR